MLVVIEDHMLLVIEDSQFTLGYGYSQFSSESSSEIFLCLIRSTLMNILKCCNVNLQIGSFDKISLMDLHLIQQKNNQLNSISLYYEIWINYPRIMYWRMYWFRLSYWLYYKIFDGNRTLSWIVKTNLKVA